MGAGRLIVYLDQSRVSEMAHVAVGTSPAGDPYRDEYKALHARLLELVRRGLIVCPFSLWHATESVLFDDDRVRTEVCSFR